MQNTASYFIRVLCAAALVAGCAPAAKDLGTTYTSPLRFKDYSCEDLHSESLHILDEIAHIGEAVDKNASETNQLIAAGAVLAPFTFGFSHLITKIKSKDRQKYKTDIVAFSKMKGNYAAVVEAAKRKGCEEIPPLPDLDVPQKDTPQKQEGR